MDLANNLAVMSSQDILDHLKNCYHAYRHTTDIDKKGLFFSPTCLQICRPSPSYAAKSRTEIIRFLKDAEVGTIPVKGTTKVESHVASSMDDTSEHGSGYYTIRPLNPAEFEFGNEAATTPIDTTPAEMMAKAEAEGWIGMRVDLWDKTAQGEILVKIQYWWRWEAIAKNEELHGDRGGYGWRQRLHDIMYLGPRDGTEGSEGLEILS